MQEWHCSECGCSFDEAQEKRRQRHEPLIRTVQEQRCSAECRRIHRRHVVALWRRGRRAGSDSQSDTLDPARLL